MWTQFKNWMRKAGNKFVEGRMATARKQIASGVYWI